MLHFIIESKKASGAAVVRRMVNGKYTFRVWHTDGSYTTFDAHGVPVNTGSASAVHPDAVAVYATMNDADIKNARRIAAARQNVRRLETVADGIMSRWPDGDGMPDAARRALLKLVNVAYHASGKIEGCFSIDGCAACDFCQRMIASAEGNPLVICGACYAYRDRYKESSWRRHSLNARILSGVLFTLDELHIIADVIADGGRCRFNEDGDTVNVIHARNLLRVAALRPDVFFGYFYKNTSAVGAGLIAEGYKTRDALPVNVRFIHSSILIGVPARPCWFDDGVFTVFPDERTTLAAVAAGMHECNGRRCRACGYMCYVAARRPEGPVFIAEFLRCTPAERAVIMTAYNALPGRVNSLYVG